MKVETKRLFLDCSEGMTRVAVTTQQGVLIEYDIGFDSDSPHAHAHRRAKNAIHNAVIKSIKPELGACFVQYSDNESGTVKDGFLPFSNISPSYLSKDTTESTEAEIARLIKPGQKILVQIKKDQLHHETKGAALTTFISLAGTYLVLLPLNQKQGISRRADTAQRDLIKETIKKLNVSEDMGIIIRTAGITASHEEIEWDYKALLQQWNKIHAAHTKLSKPCLIHEDENILTRIIRDNMSGHIDKIICNNADTAMQIRQYLEGIRPDYLETTQLEIYEHDLMFDHYSIEEQIESIFQVRSSLPSGGQIVMHGTEAGYMIDVNSSKSTFGSSIEENAVNTNKEAAIKIADILRLRDVSGIIHIDFIDMHDEKNRSMIEKIFLDRAQLDRAKIKTEPISLLTGCMSVLRQGLGTVFFKSSLEPLPNDETIIIGKRRSVLSYSQHILNVLEKSATQKTDIVQIQLPVDVATLISNELRPQIQDIEKKYKVTIYIIPNENFMYHRYILKRFHKDEELEQEQSYTVSMKNNAEKPWVSTSKENKPQISRDVSSRKIEQQKDGVFTSIWNTIFGSDEEKTTTNTNPRPSRRRHNSSPRSPHNKRSHGNPTQGRYESSKSDGNSHNQNRTDRRKNHDKKQDDGEVNYNLIDNAKSESAKQSLRTPNGNRRRGSGPRSRKPRSQSFSTTPSENKSRHLMDDD